MSLSLQAVNAALNSSWETAVLCNKKILSKNPSDISALNRLAYAFLEMGEINKAKKNYNLVLKIDPYNPIAIKNLKKIKESSFSKKNYKKPTVFSISVFLEEPGKTKIVPILKLATKSVLNSLRPRDQVVIKPKKHYIIIEDFQEKYLGSLPDDISFRLIKLINSGNKYEAFVRSVSSNSLYIFIREIFRAKKLKNTPSFVSKNDSNFSKTIDKFSKEELYSDHEDDTSSQESGNEENA